MESNLPEMVNNVHRKAEDLYNLQKTGARIEKGIQISHSHIEYLPLECRYAID